MNGENEYRRSGIANDKKAWEIRRFSCISSTNEYLKPLRAEGRNVIAVSDKQTGGRGTKGRSFVSDEGGVYFSALTFYEDLPARSAFLLLARAAVAVCRTLEGFGVFPVIKWSNDIFVRNKKICGILIENVFSAGNISSSIVGIGLNVFNRLPKELSEIATSVFEETGKKFDLEEVTQRLFAEFARADGEDLIQEYLSRIGYMGSEATLLIGDERVPATLLSVDDEGGLHVRIQGVERRLTSAEVSIRL